MHAGEPVSNARTEPADFFRILLVEAVSLLISPVNFSDTVLFQCAHSLNYAHFVSY